MSFSTPARGLFLAAGQAAQFYWTWGDWQGPRDLHPQIGPFGARWQRYCVGPHHSRDAVAGHREHFCRPRRRGSSGGTTWEYTTHQILMSSFI